MSLEILMGMGGMGTLILRLALPMDARPMDALGDIKSSNCVIGLVIMWMLEGGCVEDGLAAFVMV